MTFPAGFEFGPYEFLAAFGAGRTEDARLPITVVGGGTPVGGK